MIDLLAYKEFDSIKYVKANIARQYNTKSHYLYLLAEVLPLLIIWLFIIPSIFMIILRHGFIQVYAIILF